MKKLLLFFAVLATALAGKAEKYIMYTSTDGEVVNKSPYCDSSDLKTFGANIISNSYENGQGKILFDGEVTTIGEYAFCLCTNLETVVVPSTVTIIEPLAFLACYNLSKMEIPN